MILKILLIVPCAKSSRYFFLKQTFSHPYKCCLIYNILQRHLFCLNMSCFLDSSPLGTYCNTMLRNNKHILCQSKWVKVQLLQLLGSSYINSASGFRKDLMSTKQASLLSDMHAHISSEWCTGNIDFLSAQNWYIAYLMP
jgi:hypothetical protein